MGAGRVPELPGRPARDGDRPSGEPRVPRHGRDGPRRRGDARHAGRHRLAHDDDQRARGARLGRRRHRGRGGHARPADLHDRAAGRRRAPHGRPRERRDRHRPRADDDRAAAPARRRRQVHRVLRPRPGRAHRRRPRDDVEHVARVRGDGVDVPGRRRDACATCATPAAPPTTSTWSSATRREQGLFRDRRRSPSRPTPRRSTSTSPRSCRAWRGRAGRRIGSRSRSVGRQLRRRVRSGAKRQRPGRRVGRHLGDHVVHEHVEPGADGGRGPGGAKGGRARAHDEAVGEDEPRAGLAGRRRLPAPGRRSWSRSSSSASTSSASAAPRASGTPARCPTRSRPRSSATT